MCLSCVATNMWRGVTFVMTLMLIDLAKATIRIEKLAEKEKKEWMLNWQGTSKFKRNLHFHEWITINTTTENQRKTPHEVFQANGSIKLCTNGVWTVIWFNIYGCTDDDFWACCLTVKPPAPFTPGCPTSPYKYKTKD